MATKQFTSWSFSRYSDYKTCPAKAKYKHLDRLPEPPSEALNRGSAIHTKAEHYITRGLARLPVELKKFDKTFKHLKKQRKRNPQSILVEQSWSFTKNWEATTWNDWTGCAVRLKIDCVELAEEERIRIYDWKTGRYRPEQAEEYMAQLDLYALGALLLFPKAIVMPKLMYLDSGDIHPSIDVEHKAEDVDALKRAWGRRIEPMLNDTVFAPTPSYGCRWCPYSQEKNGPCKF